MTSPGALMMDGEASCGWFHLFLLLGNRLPAASRAVDSRGTRCGSSTMLFGRDRPFLRLQHGER